MPTVTALRAARPGWVAVELDGAYWRTLPADVVVRVGLTVDRTLDRATLRLLRRELHRAEAIAVATRALRSRDQSVRTLERRLERCGATASERTETLATLERAGIVDDGRFARNRAASLARRGYGDAAIRAKLDRDGINASVRDEALAELPPEAERAADLVRRRGPGPRTARYLAGKGFGEEAVSSALGGIFAPDP